MVKKPSEYTEYSVLEDIRTYIADHGKAPKGSEGKWKAIYQAFRADRVGGVPAGTSAPLFMLEMQAQGKLPEHIDFKAATKIAKPTLRDTFNSVVWTLKARKTIDCDSEKEITIGSLSALRPGFKTITHRDHETGRVISSEPVSWKAIATKMKSSEGLSHSTPGGLLLSTFIKHVSQRVEEGNLDVPTMKEMRKWRKEQNPTKGYILRVA